MSTTSHYEVYKQLPTLPEETIENILKAANNPLPEPKSADKGKYLKANESTGTPEWAEGDGGVWGAQNPKFVVTLTPTAADYSGTMDKTVAEINAAYEAGMEIWFKILYDQSGSYIEIPASVQHGSGAQNEGFFATLVYNGTIIVASTGVNPSADKTTYATNIYTLTPAT